MPDRQHGPPTAPSFADPGESPFLSQLRGHEGAAAALRMIDAWPPSLRMAAALLRAQGFPAHLRVGRRQVLIYNEAYARLLGPAHPHAFGRELGTEPGAAVPRLTALAERGFAGETTVLRNAFHPLRRSQEPEDAWFDISCCPVRDEAGAVAAILLVQVETTRCVIVERERDRLEAELHVGAARFRTLAEGIPQLVWRSCDQGLWTWASPQWLDYTGQTQERSHGWGWLEAIHPEDHARTMEAWAEARSHGMLDVAHRIRRAGDGAWRWHHTRSFPVRGTPEPGRPEGRILDWVGTCTDIEESRRAG